MHWIRVESKFCTEKVTRFLIFYGLFVLNLWVPISFVVTLCWTLIFSGFLWNSGKFNNFSFPYQKFQSLHVASGHLHLFWLFPLPLISVTKTTAPPPPHTPPSFYRAFLQQKRQLPTSWPSPALHLFQDPLHNSCCVPEIYVKKKNQTPR